MQIFQLDPKETLQYETITTIIGFKYKVTWDDGTVKIWGTYPPQTCAVFVVLKYWANGIVGGGFLSDGMGMEKTLIFVMVCLILEIARRRVEYDRK
jgi:hypothetical protein